MVLDNTLNPAVANMFATDEAQRLLADTLAQADVRVRFGTLDPSTDMAVFVPAENGEFNIPLRAVPKEGQTQERTTVGPLFASAGPILQPYAVEVTLSNPYTFRATALSNLTGLLAAIALFALGLSVVIASILTRRFTTPLRRLTEASRALAEGDLSQRVPAGEVGAGSIEMAELATQFNTMADRLEESVEMIRRDRDRSRDFLADVSHELRTPIAALRTFNELLKGQAGADSDARAEFLESGGQQLERLDWLATNLLELSKLDSGLVLLELRPDDLRAAVESAVEQADGAARKRGVRLTHQLPDQPLRIRHDPQRIGQVITNLVLNAIKFTPRGGVGRSPPGPRGIGRPDRRDRHGCRHRRGRAAAHLRTVLSRLAGQRGARQRQRPGTRDRPLDRRHARRRDQRREPGRRREPLHRDAPSRSADDRRDARCAAGRGRARRRRADRPRSRTRRPDSRRAAPSRARANIPETSPTDGS